MYCNCKECKLLNQIDNLCSDSLSRALGIIKGPSTYYKYINNDEKEIAYQQGMKAGLKFKYNQLVGYKALG